MYGTPRKRFSTIFVTSRQLKFCFRIFKNIRFNAFWILLAASEPKTVDSASSAMKEQFHPTLRSFWSMTLSTTHFAEYDSLPRSRIRVTRGRSSIRIVPTWTFGVMGAPPMLDKGGPVLEASLDGTLSAVRIE